MTLAGWETAVRFAGFVVLAATWVAAGVGAVKGSARGAGRAVGLARRHRAHVVYALSAVPYFALCVLLWRPLPGTPPTALRVLFLVAGLVLGLAGAGLYLYGRHALGDMYNVSSSLGAELYEGHTLVTSGPYAWCRHPMYAGLVLGAVGGLMVYRTWTLVFMCVALLGAAVKARSEERLLAAEFGPEWDRYAAAVRGWIPRRRSGTTEEVSHVERTVAT